MFVDVFDDPRNSHQVYQQIKKNYIVSLMKLDRQEVVTCLLLLLLQNEFNDRMIFEYYKLNILIFFDL